MRAAYGWLIVGNLAALSCSSSSETKPAAGASTCDQVCQDSIVGFAIDDTMWLIWNQNFAGQPSGAQDLTVNCPLGGTAQVTGTTAVASNGINTIHLTFTLQDCANSDTYYALMLTGTLTWDGTFSSGNSNALTFRSTSLSIEGQVRTYDKPTISETCDVSLTDTYNDTASSQTAWLNGQICGRAVNE